MPRRFRAERTSISVVLQMVANWRSEKPNCLAFRSIGSPAADRLPILRSSSSISTISYRLSRNHGSIAVNSLISSTDIPYFMA